MPITISEADHGLGSIIQATGILTDDEYIHSINKHLSQQEDILKKHLYSISDYSNVTELNISKEAIQKIAKRCIQYSTINQNIIIVIVAGSDLAYGLARMWGLLTDGSNLKINIVRTRNEAENWIKSTLNEKRETKKLNLQFH